MSTTSDDFKVLIAVISFGISFVTFLFVMPWLDAVTIWW